MHRDLVEEKRIAQQADATATFPAGRYTSLFVFTVAPAQNHTLEENQKALDGLLGRFQSKPVDAETLERAKNTIRARVVRGLASNQQLAAMLPEYYAAYGDWRKLFTILSEVKRVTAEDLQRVAAQYFTSSNRTVAYITDVAPTVTAPAGAGGPQ
jgi:predicted Zn-dependent peptidase